MDWLVFSVKEEWKDRLEKILSDTQETSKKEDDWDLPYDFQYGLLRVGCRDESHCHRLGKFLCKKVIPEEFDERPDYWIKEE